MYLNTPRVITVTLADCRCIGFDSVARLAMGEKLYVIDATTGHDDPECQPMKALGVVVACDDSFITVQVDKKTTQQYGRNARYFIAMRSISPICRATDRLTYWEKQLDKHEEALIKATTQREQRRLQNEANTALDLIDYFQRWLDDIQALNELISLG